MPILTAIAASSAKAYGFTGGGGVQFIVATGGTVTDYNGFRIHRFTSSDNFVITAAPAGATFELFIIGGGGGGGLGSNSGPGGGAGGAYDNTTYPCPAAGTYPIVIGAGGAGTAVTIGNGTIGGASTAFGLTLVGGGTQNVNTGGWTLAGGDQGTWGFGRSIADGGSGCGVANGSSLASHPRWGDTTNRGRTVYDSTGGFSGSNQTYYYGFASGIGQSTGGAGGGGIGGVGGDAVSSPAIVGGDGGLGRSYNWVGSTEWMGGGGGGGNGAGMPAGIGGSGVGGAGVAAPGNGGNAVANTGSGGGGAGGSAPDVGGNGSAGLVIIKYAIA